MDAARAFNPHMHYARADQRGLMQFRLDAKRLHAEVLAVRDILHPDSALHVAARYAVDCTQPGAMAA